MPRVPHTDQPTADPTGPPRTAADEGGRPRNPTDLLRVRIGCVLIVVVLVVLGAVWWQSTELPSGAAFRANGEVTTIDQLDDRIATLHALYGLSPPADPAQADAFRREVAKSVAVSDVLDRAVSDEQITVPQQEVDQATSAYVARFFGVGGTDTFVEALAAAGTSIDAVQDEIRRQLAVTELMSKVVGTPSVSDEDLRVAFDQRRSSLGTPEKRSLRNIVLIDRPSALAALDRLKAGEPFEKVASTSSLDAVTRSRGGWLGEVTRTDLESPVAAAAFAVGVGVGQLYGPVNGSRGWNVGRVEAIVAPAPLTFEQAAPALRRRLQAERTLPAWQDWLQRRMRDAHVEYSDAYRPADPDPLPTDGTPALPHG
ncbi:MULTISPECIES: peptidyl-prolyl cis-trans isomerase [unclassified Pseudonocardia]|uniref:peptidylprolyl isomerase n=1 Tax=unclassified Pseudonocardia TaxID=2619320 RepID=UPI0025EDCDA7|nr:MULTISPECIES: peptidyl-prolyl cis-trans isomerase [unclassified Pseudonocardia]